MKLAEFLANRDLTLEAFGALIEVSPSAVHRYVTGKRIPKPRTMERIKVATGGLVQAVDFYPSAPSGEGAGSPEPTEAANG